MIFREIELSMSLPVPSSVVGVGDNFDHYQHVIDLRGENEKVQSTIGTRIKYNHICQVFVRLTFVEVDI